STRAAAPNGPSRVAGSDLADRLGAGARDRSDEGPEILLRVAEHLLAARDGGVGVDDVLEVGKVLEAHETRVEPLVVRVLTGQGVLDLVVLDDAVLREV